MALSSISNLKECVSDSERKQRFGVVTINVIVWLFIGLMVVSTAGFVLIFAVPGLILHWLLAEYNVRKVQALGVTISKRQIPQLQQMADEVCARFGIERTPKIIVINSGESNAFSLRFARKKVIILLSDLLYGVSQNPSEVKFILGHEICHAVMDHGLRGVLEIYKPAKYKQARELTCDNAGLVAAGSLDGSLTALRKLCVGHRLHKWLDNSALIEEANQIYSGLTGWLVRQHLSHPPAGSRIENLARFYQENGQTAAG